MPNQVDGVTSHHVRYRAVPRTNRTPSTVNTRGHFATSSTNALPACGPSRPWQCSDADASPSASTDVASPYCCAPPLAPPPPAKAQQRIALRADVPQSLLAPTRVFTGNHPHVVADLLATMKPAGSSNDQHIREGRKRAHARMCHQAGYLGPRLGDHSSAS